MSFIRSLLGGGPDYAQVDVQTLSRQLDAGEVTLLLDVRTEFEYKGGHVDGAVNIPVQELARRATEIEGHRDGYIAVICRSGARSGSACGWMQRAGYNVANVAGGMLDWERAGLPIK